MSKDKIVNVKSLADISPASKGYVDLPRDSGNLRVPVKGLSLKDQNELEEKYQLPEAPKQWKRVQGFDKPIMVENTDDPAYQKEKRQIILNQTRENILRGIDIEIEGSSIDEKWQALLDTGLAVGDIVLLSSKIMELSNLKETDVEAIKDFFE